MTEGDAKAKRRGRKSSSSDTKQRRTLAFRVRSELLEELERSAQKHGRSISEEVEYNLEINYGNRTLIELYPNPAGLEAVAEMNEAIARINEEESFRGDLLRILLIMIDVVKTSKIKRVHDKAKSIAEFIDKVGKFRIAEKLFKNEYFGNDTISENIHRAAEEIENNLNTD